MAVALEVAVVRRFYYMYIFEISVMYQARGRENALQCLGKTITEILFYDDDPGFKCNSR